MINRRYAGIAAAVLALAIAAAPMEAQAPVRVPTPVLERYVGEYDQNGSTIKILLAGDTLIRETSGQRVAFVPISVIYRKEKSKIRPLRDTLRWFRWLKDWQRRA